VSTNSAFSVLALKISVEPKNSFLGIEHQTILFVLMKFFFVYLLNTMDYYLSFLEIDLRWVFFFFFFFF